MWGRLECRGPLRPPMRYQVASTILGDCLYVHGGQGSGKGNLLWQLDLTTPRWSPLDGSSPLCSNRLNHVLCGWDRRLWVFGGQGAGSTAVDMFRERKAEPGASSLAVKMCAARNVLNDVLTFDLDLREWREVHRLGIWPTPRRGHTATLVADSPRIARLVEEQRLDDEERRRAASPDAQPRGGDDGRSPPRRGRRPLGTGGYVLVLGGAGPVGTGFEVIHGQLWAFRIRDEAWVDLTAACAGAAPPARFEHTATLHRGALVVVGGLAPRDVSGDASTKPVLVLDVEMLSWSTLSFSHAAAGAPALHGHAALCVPGADEAIIVFGGRLGGAEVRTLEVHAAEGLCTWRTAPLQNQWAPPAADPAPDAPDDDDALDAAVEAPSPRVGHVFAYYVPPPRQAALQDGPRAVVDGEAAPEGRRRGGDGGPFSGFERPTLLVYGGSEVTQSAGLYVTPDVFALDAAAASSRTATPPRGYGFGGASPPPRACAAARGAARRRADALARATALDAAEDAFEAVIFESVIEQTLGGPAAPRNARDNYAATKKMLLDAHKQRLRIAPECLERRALPPLDADDASLSSHASHASFASHASQASHASHASTATFRSLAGAPPSLNDALQFRTTNSLQALQREAPSLPELGARAASIARQTRNRAAAKQLWLEEAGALGPLAY
ncbi:hypothetical protein M885DRAFT_539242 [Pelagophyceae sp. CCMP2097]|nr:hypothetical protein M885DRAFT_539242 [Pelagophyceae sp. CCMP2097]